MKRLTTKDVKKMYEHELRSEHFFDYEVYLKYQLPLPSELAPHDTFRYTYHDLYSTLTFIKMIQGGEVPTEELEYRKDNLEKWKKIIQNAILLNRETLKSYQVEDFDLIMAMTHIDDHGVGIDKYKIVQRYANDLHLISLQWEPITTAGYVQ